MASLKKPEKCNECDSTQIKHEWRPEKWVCHLGHVIVVRKELVSGICRECGKSKADVPFASHGNICKPCKALCFAEYKTINRDKLLANHRETYKRDREKRIAAIRASISRSPEAFLRYVAHDAARSMRRGIVRRGQLIKRDGDIDYGFLLDLYKKQNGKCAITGMQMDHKRGSLLTISIDRVDSSRGYFKDNVQLVCQFINLAKNTHTNAKVLAVLDAYVAHKKSMTITHQPTIVLQPSILPPPQIITTRPIILPPSIVDSSPTHEPTPSATKELAQEIVPDGALLVSDGLKKSLPSNWMMYET